MKNLKKYAFLAVATGLVLSSCRSDEKKSTTPATNNVTLTFNNVFAGQPLKIGADVASATPYSSNGNTIKFSEVKYVITNVVLVNSAGKEVPYHIDNLDKGGFLVDQAKPETYNVVLKDIPAGDYKTIKFGLGVQKKYNDLAKQQQFPAFYKLTGENDDFKGKMHWEWSGGYRFVKLEGWYGDENKTLSIHIGSAFKKIDPKGGKGDDNTTTDDTREAFRYVSLDLPNTASVGANSPKITINADFDKLTNGTNKIAFTGNNTVPVIHTLNGMFPYVNNLGGNQDLNGKQIIVKKLGDPTKPQEGINNDVFDKQGMFSISKVE